MPDSSLFFTELQIGIMQWYEAQVSFTVKTYMKKYLVIKTKTAFSWNNWNRNVLRIVMKRT